MSVSGFNFLSRNIIEHEIKKALKKETGSNFDVKINNFWGSSILNGEFQSLTLKSKNYSHDGFNSTDLLIETICPYNKVSYVNNEIKFDYDTVLKFSTTITQQDLNKSLQEGELSKFLNKINSSLIKIQSSNLEIQNDKLIFKYKIIPLNLGNFIKPISLSFSSKLKVKNNQLELCNVSFNKKQINYSQLLNMFDLTNLKVNLDRNNKAKVKIEDVEIKNSKIELLGYVIILKTK